MKKRKQWILLFCIALTVCLASGAMLYVRQKNNNKKWRYRNERAGYDQLITGM